jgi:hypothetical protein
MENLNSSKYLDEIKVQVMGILDGVTAVSTPIYTGQDGTTMVPEDSDANTESIRDKELGPDERDETGGRIEHAAEFYDTKNEMDVQ